MPNGSRDRKGTDKLVSAALRTRLNNTRDWLQAQILFNDLCDVVGVKRATVRQCRRCGFYGHSARTCPHYDAEIVEARRVRLEADAVDTPWAREVRALNAHVEEGVRRGIAAGRAWDEWVAPHLQKSAVVEKASSSQALGSGSS